MHEIERPTVCVDSKLMNLGMDQFRQTLKWTNFKISWYMQQEQQFFVLIWDFTVGEENRRNRSINANLK